MIGLLLLWVVVLLRAIRPSIRLVVLLVTLILLHGISARNYGSGTMATKQQRQQYQQERGDEYKQDKTRKLLLLLVVVVISLIVASRLGAVWISLIPVYRWLVQWMLRNSSSRINDKERPVC
jgi:cobalamin synthase